MGIFDNLFNSVNYPALLGAGIAIRLIIEMRRFKRRGVGGLQHFNNYFLGLVTLFAEWIFKWIANGMIVWGLLGWSLT